MTKNQSPFSAVRLRTRWAWVGPEYLSWEEDSEPYAGMPVISLSLTSFDKDQIDSRVVYADMFDESQESAILRAAYWNGDPIRKAVRDEGTDFTPVIPVKFVRIDIKELNTWLIELDGLRVQIPSKCERVPTEDIRSLRTSVDYKSCIFEFVWQSNEKRLETLNNKWNSIWQKMSDALSINDSMVSFEEHYWFVEPKFRYELVSYDIRRAENKF